MKQKQVDVGLFCFETQQLAVTVHTHHAIQLVVSLDTPFSSTLGGDLHHDIYGFLADSDLMHACQSQNSHLLIVNFSPESELGRSIREYHLPEHRYKIIDNVFSKESYHDITSSYGDYKRNCITLSDFLRRLRMAIYPVEYSEVESLDERVENVLDKIDSEFSRKITVRELARSVNLSQSRLRSLFKHDIGIPVTSYLQWIRIKYALKYLFVEEYSLSEAAVASGFYDQPHFTRVFRKFFGISPLLFVKNSQFIQSLLV
jgi:AraC-like DNA-binding protein